MVQTDERPLVEFTACIEEIEQKPPTRVADLMSRHTITLAPHHSFADAVSLMANQNIRHIIVIDVRGRLVGVISDRDIMRALGRTPDWSTKDIGQLMTRNPHTVTPQTCLSVAVSKMLSKRINCLPVLSEEGTVCGILTSTDLLKSYRKDLEAAEKLQRIIDKPSEL